MSVPIQGNILNLLVIDFGGSKTWNAVNDTTAEQTVTVPGLKVGDVVVGILKPSAQTGLGPLAGRVSAADTLAVTFITTANVTPTANETMKVIIARPERTRTDAVA